MPTTQMKISGKKNASRTPKSVEIRRADNGFTTHTAYDQPQDPKTPYQEPELNVHETGDSVMDHVANVFGFKQATQGRKKPAATAPNPKVAKMPASKSDGKLKDAAVAVKGKAAA